MAHQRESTMFGMSKLCRRRGSLLHRRRKNPKTADRTLLSGQQLGFKCHTDTVYHYVHFLQSSADHKDGAIVWDELHCYAFCLHNGEEFGDLVPGPVGACKSQRSASHHDVTGSTAGPPITKSTSHVHIGSRSSFVVSTQLHIENIQDERELQVE
ncbi:hypothetical protein RvY_08887 [Ramazzottius varieornatus]|uniref:Uncharacterized protein n=1 Tax=Ramazzottius varieornatus TaxID=947166 RepID=A0A1D1V7E8_RAMVA|nr:hypothetical protein RvY_08887 [Ramazzottius varieornatus]